MARKQPQSQKPEVEELTPEAPEPAESSAKSTIVTKADAIRAAIRAGIDSPTEAEKYIRKRFGLTVSRTHFSAFKSQAKKASSPGGSSKSSGSLEATKLDAIGDSELLEALEMMKPLVASLGADKVKRIVDLLD